MSEEGEPQEPSGGLRAACPHVLADPTSLPNISGDIKLTVTPRRSQLG